MRGVLVALCLVGLVLGSWSCTDRDLGDEAMDDEPSEHPAELLERYEQACEDYCELYETCTGEEPTCSCRDRELGHQPTLCVEKTALFFECRASLTCEQLDVDNSLPASDQLCHGHGSAKAGACR